MGGSIPNQTEQPAGEAEADLDGGDVDKAPDKGTGSTGENSGEETNLNKVGSFEDLYGDNVEVKSALGVQNLLAGENGEHSHFLCGEDTCNEVGHDEESDITTFATAIYMENGTLKKGDSDWTVSTDGYTLSEGTYYLYTDITLDKKIIIGGSVTLCLNGHSITKNGNTSEVIDVHDGNLTLTDCKDDSSDGSYGEITHGSDSKGNGVYIYNGSTFNMYGGNITGNTTQANGGGVRVLSNSTFNMYGGSITGNSAQKGGGMYVDGNSKFTMTGGRISENNAIYTDDQSNNGGGVYVYSGTFTVSGTVKIVDNIKGGTLNSETGKYTGGTANNVYLRSNTTINIGEGGLIEGAKIGVTLAGTYGDNSFTNGWNNVSGVNPTDYFTSDDSTKKAVLNDQGSELKLGPSHTDHFLCGGDTCTKVGHDEEGNETKFTAWTKTNALPNEDGKYYLTADVELSSTWNLQSPVKNVVLCLNGHTITSNANEDVINVWNGRSLTLTDCSKGKSGKVTHESSTTGRGVCVSAGSTFTLYGGSITGNKTANGYGGGGVIVYGTFTMCGGSISGNNAGYGGVYVGDDNYAGTFTMYGGSISGNTAKWGGGVYAKNGTFNMYGDSSITGNNANIYGGGVYVYTNGTFTMSGDSSITGNNAGNGGGVFVNTPNTGTFTMSGGSITGNNAGSGNGGGVYVYDGTFTMSNGSITGNNATSNGTTDSGNGGGVYVSNIISSSKFVMQNGSITGNYAGGTRRTESGSYEKGESGKDNNVYLPKDKTIDASELSSTGGTIGVTTAVKPADGSSVTIATGAKGDVDYGSIFIPDVKDQDYTITSSGENVYLNAHTHNWSYSGSGATITATCGGCGKSGSVTVNAPTDLTYDGNDKVATVTKSDWPGDDVTITYSPVGTPKNAGTYTASIKLGDAEASVTYTIAKATPQADNFTFTAPRDLSYDGNAKEATVTVKSGITGMGEVTVKYLDEDGNSVAATEVKSAGKYIVKISVSEGTNYNAASTDITDEKWEFTIAKAKRGDEQITREVVIPGEASVDITLPKLLTLPEGAIYGTPVYDQKAKDSSGNEKNYTILASGAKGLEGNVLNLKVECSEVGVSQKVSIPVTNMTNYENYNIVVTIKMVDKKDANVSISGLPARINYGDTITLTASQTGDTIGANKKWSWDYDTTYFNSLESNANTGTIKLQAIKAGAPTKTIKVTYESDTHKGSNSVTVSSIAKKTLTKDDLAGIPKPLTKEYDGTNAYTNSIYLTLTNDAKAFENDNLQIGIDANQITFAQRNAGDTTATITLKSLPDAWNYKFADGFTEITNIPAEITKATPTVSGTGTAIGTYGQKLSEVTVNGLNATLNGETVAGSWALKGAENATLDEVTPSGSTSEYTAVFTPKDTNNYNTVEKKVDVTVNPKAGGSLGTVNLTQKYTDETEKKYEPNWTGLPDGETWSYNGNVVKSDDSITLNKNDFNADGTTLTYSISGGKAGDKVTFTLTATCSSGHYTPFTITVVVELIEREPQKGFKFENDTKTVTYGDPDFTVEAIGAVTGSKVTYSSSNEKVATVDNDGKVTIIGAGTATISATASETADYNAKTVSYTLKVNKKQITVPTADSTEYTYNGEKQTYKLAENKAYTITGNKQTNADSYTVTVALKDKANTQWADNTTDDKTYSFVIKKATVTITVKDKTAYVKGTAPDLSSPDDYTVSGLIESDTLIALPTLKYIDADNKEITPDMTKTGEYIINADGADAGDNYTISYKDGKLTVKNKTTGGHTKKTEVVTKDKVTTSPAEVKTDETGTATATVTDANQKEIIKQVKDNKSEEIVINVSEKDIADGARIEINLDKEFIDSIVNDTDARLTIKTPAGDRTFTKEELKKLSENSSEGKITISPADDDLAIAKAKELTEKLSLTARSSKTAKGNIKVVLKNSTDTKDLIKEIEELGFTVKYRFYRSTRKSSGYKSTLTKDTDSYTNTTGKKGTKYFYKVRVMVYDADGNLVAKSDLKQCSYAARTWSK